MKRIYACLGIVVALLAVAFYRSFRVQMFAEDISGDIDHAMEAIREDDLTGARQALAEGADLCDRMREGMNHLLKTEDFTELEAALRAADGHLEWNAPEEAFGGAAPRSGPGRNAGLARPSHPLRQFSISHNQTYANDLLQRKSAQPCRPNPGGGCALF